MNECTETTNKLYEICSIIDYAINKNDGKDFWKHMEEIFFNFPIFLHVEDDIWVKIQWRLKKNAIWISKGRATTSQWSSLCRGPCVGTGLICLHMGVHITKAKWARSIVVDEARGFKGNLFFPSNLVLSEIRSHWTTLKIGLI